MGCLWGLTGLLGAETPGWAGSRTSPSTTSFARSSQAFVESGPPGPPGLPGEGAGAWGRAEGPFGGARTPQGLAHGFAGSDHGQEWTLSSHPLAAHNSDPAPC